MPELSPETLIPAAIALALVGGFGLWRWIRRERGLATAEAERHRLEAELRAIARRRQRERDSALQAWLEDEPEPPSSWIVSTPPMLEAQARNAGHPLH